MGFAAPTAFFARGPGGKVLKSGNAGKATKVAGFEWGTGFYINPVSPEESASALRDAEI